MPQNGTLAGGCPTRVAIPLMSMAGRSIRAGGRAHASVGSLVSGGQTTLRTPSLLASILSDHISFRWCAPQMSSLPLPPPPHPPTHQKEREYDWNAVPIAGS